jgi:hypothetical protein
MQDPASGHASGGDWLVAGRVVICSIQAQSSLPLKDQARWGRSVVHLKCDLTSYAIRSYLALIINRC